MKPAHTSLTLTSHGWDSETQGDIELPSVFVTIWVKAGGSTGRALEHECSSAKELWELVRDLNRDRKSTLARTFNYVEPENPSGLPTNLGDLFT